ncbi:DUF461 domain-containing protein [Streptomyces meridianus]|uniref:DUF461 domain-containing protein n=1 Tax=Streptomyces meridianus TaxID=2938945 RepID=A0ABT0X4L6_9ACTN|nr:DUF461 domain-containing protein [Streptomyces meridianus]MCM2577275.1 DUF461 domain-containing protein [Streptomyces meridianus]
MSCSLRRGALAASALVFSLLSLTACAAGNSAATNGIRPDNAETSVGDIKIQNANVITQPDDAEGPAVVTAKIFNNGNRAQTLESVTLPRTSAEVKLAPAKGSGPLTVPAHGTLILGGKGNASAVIENGRGEAGRDGDAQRIVFAFNRTGEVRITGFVQPNRGYFTEFGPSSEPSPSVSTLPTGSASPSASESASGEATSTAGAAGSGAGTDGASATAGEHAGH